MALNKVSNPLLNTELGKWKKHRRQLVGNRHGISIIGDAVDSENNTQKYSFEKKKGVYTATLNPQEFERKARKVKYKFTIQNDTNKKCITLVNMKLLHPTVMFKLLNSAGRRENEANRTLNPKEEHSVFVEFTLPKAVIDGEFEIPIVFNFQVNDTTLKFSIAREIVVIITEDTKANSEIDKSPFTSNSWPSAIIIKNNTKGKPNDQYEIPDNYRVILEYNYNVKLIDSFDYPPEYQESYNKIRKVLSNKHFYYIEYFQLLLWLDETAKSIMLSNYNMETATVTVGNTKDFLTILVPGLAEKRPSLRKADRVQVKLRVDGTEDGVAYEGIITDIQYNVIQVEHFNPGLFQRIARSSEVQYDVRFVLGRLPLERIHASLIKCVHKGMLSVLHPDSKITERTKPIKYIIRDSDLLNKAIATNEEQKIAVQNIVNGTSMEAPYIVFGPPGTGKTVTIIEAILQIKKLRKGSKIVVCAKANDVCDMLAIKLLKHCTKQELIRIHSSNRETEIPNQLIDYSNYDDGKYVTISETALAKYRIVVTTLIIISGLTDNYQPDVVFIDEAAQATEPETYCAIALLTPGKQLILAGDPEQLGPVCCSVLANERELGTSLLEQLTTSNNLYKTNDPRFITTLKQNYRSHPKILELPNQLFYKNQLKAVNVQVENDPIASIFVYPRILNKDLLVPGAPVEFCAVSANEKKQGQSPSFFNQLEVETVIKYVEAMMSLRENNIKVAQTDIGIVTPYKRQMYRIKECLMEKEWENIEVGTVETFQGREKRVIIITTVRAQRSLLLQDKEYDLGFVRNEKRFNVAITRAKSKLIVIGCPIVLGNLGYDKNTCWNKYIEFCEEVDGYFGINYEKRTHDVQKLILEAFQMVTFED